MSIGLDSCLLKENLGIEVCIVAIEIIVLGTCIGLHSHLPGEYLRGGVFVIAVAFEAIWALTIISL